MITLGFKAKANIHSVNIYLSDHCGGNWENNSEKNNKVSDTYLKFPE